MYPSIHHFREQIQIGDANHGFLRDPQIKAAADNIPEVGQDEETLEEFDLNHKMIIQASERMQERAGEFRPRNMELLQSMFEDMIENPADDLDDDAVLERMLVFNVPVCDLDELSDDQIVTDIYSVCSKTVHKTMEAAKCLAHIASYSCKNLKLGGSEWPYDEPV